MNEFKYTRPFTDSGSLEKPVDGKAVWQLLLLISLGCVSLLLSDAFTEFLSGELFNALAPDLTQSANYRLLLNLFLFNLVRFSFWVILPLLVLFIFGIKPLSLGIGFGTLKSNIRHYMVIYAFMLPFILFASILPSFRHYYLPLTPFGVSEPRLIVLKALINILDFISVEFLFRGFLIHGFKKFFGGYAIFLQILPYCMIHFDKPVLEALGSIPAGFLLGALSLKTQSIWGGVMLHFCVEFTLILSLNTTTF